MTFNPNNPTASGLVLTFDDEFDGVSWSSNGPADGTLWTDQGINPGPPNGIAAISPNNLSVSNGVLDITASEGANGTWTSGMLTTVNSALQGFTQKFGYFEADIQIPKGDGAWPAWWLYSANHFINGAPPSEIDIMENAGSNTTNFGTTIHDGLGNQNPNVVQNAGVDLSAGFHRYGMLWDPNSSSVTWYLDGNAVATSAKFSDTDMQKMLMTLDLEVGNFGGGGPDASTPSTMNMLVDYVRVYQFASQNPVAVQPEAVSTAAGNTDPTALVNALGVAPSGSTSQPASVSADGTALHAGAGGNLTTSAGTWTLSANTAPGGDVVLLNGQQATDGAATELIVENNGHMFADNAQGNWYEWVNGNWSQTTDPVPVAASGSTSALTSPSAPTAVSADGTALHAGAGGSLVTSDGTWTLSANTAPGGDVILLNGQQATDGAATELIVENNGHMFAENAQGNWYEWVNGNWSQTTDPVPVAAPTAVSADGTALQAGAGGSLVTSDGTWTLSANTAPGGDVVLLNGQQATDGAATELIVENNGHMFAENAQGNWYEWVNGNWSQTTDPVPVAASGSTSAPTAVTADGTALHAGAGGSLVTSDGTWTLSANTAPGGDVVLLNGQQATDGAATELIVENNGHMFAENTQGNWYEWANGNWSQTTNPTADSSILTAGSGGNLTTSSGTWTLGAHTAPGGDVILLNGQQAGNGAATRLVVDNHGDLLADNSGGNWYEWAGGHWSQVHPTAAQGGSGTTAPPTLTPSFIDAANHDIFVFNSMTSASQIANFNGSEDVLDVTSLLKSVGYTGTDPIADHVLNLVQSGTDSTAVMVDPTGHNPSHGTTLVTLDHVLPQNVATANIWH